MSSVSSLSRRGSAKYTTYREDPDGVDTQLIKLSVTHFGGVSAVPMSEDGVVSMERAGKIV